MKLRRMAKNTAGSSTHDDALAVTGARSPAKPKTTCRWAIIFAKRSTKTLGIIQKSLGCFMPMACQHCEDAPCIKACPCGALQKGAGGSVVIDYNSCCGHATCAEVCPYGAIYIDPVANQAVKCHNCYHRIEDDMEPACANTCPADAIYFGDLNDENSKVSMALKEAEENGVGTTQLRAEKGTKPRMWFAGDAPVEVEERIPKEGESYSPDAYNIYNWKENPNA